MSKAHRYRIGILALQGGFEAHANALATFPVTVCYVRYAKDINSLDGLILPGGESTSLRCLLDTALLSAIQQFSAKQKPIFGTCAGSILLAKKIESPEAAPFLDLMHIAVKRNAYGRQIASEIKQGQYVDEPEKTPMLFIRAPQLRALSNTVIPLAHCEGEVVAFQENHLIAASFHPELLPSDRHLHKRFFQLVEEVAASSPNCQ